MDKKQILASLNKIANDLDQKSEFEHSDKITNLMIKISQMPTPNAPVKPNSFFQNVGNAFSNMGRAIGQGVQDLGQGVKDIAGEAPGIVSEMIKLPSDAGGMGARYFLNSQFNQKLQNDKVYREKEKLRYNVEIETKKIIDEIITQLKSNKNLTLDMAKQQAINKAQTHPNFKQINTYTTTYNKMNFADVITTKFDTYVAKLFPDRASIQTNQVTPTSQTWIPPVEKY